MIKMSTRVKNAIKDIGLPIKEITYNQIRSYRNFGHGYIKEFYNLKDQGIELHESVILHVEDRERRASEKHEIRPFVHGKQVELSDIEFKCRKCGNIYEFNSWRGKRQSGGFCGHNNPYIKEINYIVYWQKSYSKPESKLYSNISEAKRRIESLNLLSCTYEVKQHIKRDDVSVYLN